MIELKHIFKKYGSRDILKNINLTLPDVGLISILGKSGSGKSTLLNLIGLLDKPSSGKIFVDGVNISTLKKSEVDYYHFKYVGFIFQQYNLFNNLSVKDNILLVDNYKELDELLSKFDLDGLKNKKMSKLSGGEKQRVAIIRSIIKKPKILLCDEPTGALDSKMSKSIMEMLKKLSKEMLVIVVTHNEELANNYSDEVIKIEDGKIYQKKKHYHLKYLFKKEKVIIKLKKLIKIVIMNLLKNKKRNFLTIIALFIGFFSLCLVLGISDGFVSSIEYENKNSMSKFPIYISRTSTNIVDDLNSLLNKNNKNDKVYVYEYNHINKYDSEYINNLNKIDNNLSYKVFSYNYKDTVINVSKINNIFENFLLLNGRHIINDNEVFLLLNDDYTIDANLLYGIGLGKNEYDFSELVGYNYIINDKLFTIVGVGKVMDSSENIFTSGLYYQDFFKNEPDLISLYPKDYVNKIKVLNHLKEYKDIYYTDYADSITDISKTLIKSIKMILIAFSFLSLFVSIIMIGILCYVNIMERIKEIGILKSLGVSNRKVKFIFYIENIIICLCSSLLSIISLKTLTGFINDMLYKIILLSILIGIISSYLPIKSVKKYTIIDTINNE